MKKIKNKCEEKHFSSVSALSIQNIENRGQNMQEICSWEKFNYPSALLHPRLLFRNSGILIQRQSVKYFLLS